MPDRGIGSFSNWSWTTPSGRHRWWDQHSLGWRQGAGAPQRPHQNNLQWATWKGASKQSHPPRTRSDNIRGQLQERGEGERSGTDKQKNEVPQSQKVQETEEERKERKAKEKEAQNKSVSAGTMVHHLAEVYHRGKLVREKFNVYTVARSAIHQATRRSLAQIECRNEHLWRRSW